MLFVTTVLLGRIQLQLYEGPYLGLCKLHGISHELLRDLQLDGK